MGSKICVACGDCGKGISKPTVEKNDPVFVALCQILCKVRMEVCEGKHKGQKPSSVAEKRAKKDSRLKRALGSRKGIVNKQRYVRFDNMPPNWKRVKVAKETLDRQLDAVIKQIEKKAAKIMATKAAKKAASIWIKFVPVLNVISTAYDIYDLATTGYGIYDQIKTAKEQFSGDVYRTRPDLAVTGENGKLEGIYDFKFDGDDWGEGQKELYDRDLKNSGAGEEEAKTVNSRNCGCDGPAHVKSMG